MPSSYHVLRSVVTHDAMASAATPASVPFAFILASLQHSTSERRHPRHGVGLTVTAPES